MRPLTSRANTGKVRFMFTGGLTSFISLLFYSLTMIAAKTPAEREYREELVAAILTTDANEHEQRVLVSLVRHETLFVPRWGAPRCECHGKECDGGAARGAWQIIPRNPDERAALCVSLEADAAIALFRLRESYNICAMHGLPRNERLAIYARGSCSSAEGKRLSRIRWVE